MRQYDDLLIDALLDHGFTVQEAQSLIMLQERVERERQKEDRQRRTSQWPANGSQSDPREHRN
jgi:hypothetical protein